MYTAMKLLARPSTFATTIQASTLLQGFVLSGMPFSCFHVDIVDSIGKKLSAQTDNADRYSLIINSLRPPLTLSTKTAGTVTDCLYNDELHAHCTASLLHHTVQRSVSFRSRVRHGIY